jgi:uncharacterized delta-60 repeat protein
LCYERRVKRALALMLAACGLLFAVGAGAAPGNLDPGFGRGGIVNTSFGSGDDEARAVALQQNGKIVVTGIYGNDFALARYQRDGELDPDFGDGGRVRSQFGGAATSLDVAVQPDWKIVTVGVVDDGTQQVIALARYRPNGSLDPTFGTGGEVTAAFGQESATGLSVALQPDGKIVVAGAVGPANTENDDLALARFNRSGSLDQSFGTGGEVRTSFGADATIGWSVAVHRGKIVVAGERYDPVQGRDVGFAVARYDSHGNLDPSFGAGGRATTVFEGGGAAYALAIQPDGRIVAAGTSGRGEVAGQFALVRYRPDGELDSSFGSDGRVATEFSSIDDYVTGLALQPDGKIVAGGASNLDGLYTFALARYEPNGELDLRFGQLGTVQTAFGEKVDAAANDLAIQRNGKLVLVGGSYDFTDDHSAFAVARYLNHQTVCAVPRVLRERVRRAKREIRRAHCKVGRVKRTFSHFVRRGRVISQTPGPGSRRIRGTPVDLLVSRGRR